MKINGLILLIIAVLWGMPSQAETLAPEKIDNGWQVNEAQQTVNPRSELWRAVRQGEAGYSALQNAPGDERNVLINAQGETWRQLRQNWLVAYSGWLLLGVIVAIGVFYLIVGGVKLEHGRSGQTVVRWGVLSRFVHWYTAILFLVLAVTGLSLLLGRTLLIPIIGHETFAGYAFWAKEFHNYLGPFFTLGILGMALLWMRDNIFNPKEDMSWLLAGGGIIGKGHPSAGRFNFGEKTWYWVVILMGGVVIVTGLILDFPLFGLTRNEMQIAHLIHAVLAVGLIAFSFGHIYMGTAGSEGSLESMITGKVDVNWAKQHHDLWYAKLPEAKAEEHASSSEPTPPIKHALPWR